MTAGRADYITLRIAGKTGGPSPSVGSVGRAVEPSKPARAWIEAATNCIHLLAAGVTESLWVQHLPTLSYSTRMGVFYEILAKFNTSRRHVSSAWL